MDERVSVINTWVDKGSGNHLGHVICERPPDMTQCPDVIMCRSTLMSEMWLEKVRLLSRVTPRVTILSERGTTVSAILTPVRGGKLQRQVDVPNRMNSDLLLLSPVRCDRTRSVRMWGMIPRYLDWQSGHVQRCIVQVLTWCNYSIGWLMSDGWY